MSGRRAIDHTDRDLAGYGASVPDAQWPNGARIAVSFVLNYEEGGEHTLLNGDAHSEAFLTEGGATAGARPARNLGTESGYEYGSHRGFWRILELFQEKGITFTSWAIGRAVELNPQVVPAMQAAGCEPASHSYRWIDYFDVPEEQERKHVQDTIKAITEASNDSKTPPIGWYTGRQSLQTRRIVYEEYEKRGLLDKLYDNDAYDEDLPYWVSSPSPSTSKQPLLVVPYTLDNNDMKFAQAPGFNTSSAFFDYLKDAFDLLYREGSPVSEGGKGKPKMMTIGLHCRVVGRPGRFVGLQRFVEYVMSKQHVWIANRQDIAAHWRKTHPPPKELLHASVHSTIMKLYALLVFANPPGAPAVPLISAWDLASFGWMQRGTVQDVMAFMSKTVAERTAPTQRQSVQENSYVAHVHSRPASDGICGVLVSDAEYPTRVAFSLLNKTLDEFVIKLPRSRYDAQVNRITTGGASLPSKGEGLLNAQTDFPQAQEYLARYQDPRQADTIMKVQQELDETKIVLHQTIESVLQRGEDLDKLVEKSGSLNAQSKMFYRTAKKQNSCCIVM